MKRMRWGYIGIAVLLCLCLIACEGQEAGVAEVLAELTEVCETLPDGEIYRSGAEEGSEGYLSPYLAESLYGENVGALFDTVEEYAIYLSSFVVPIEIAVFRCYSATDAHQIEAMCLNRGEALRVALRGTEFEALSDSLRVLCRGRYVVMLLGEDPEKMEEKALALIR